ncbi:lipid A biosynthesis acyltransferase [bacterium]|nr:lipid A biosynthesis acyltransferase [bacterium]
MARKARKPFLDRAVYVAVRLAVAVVHALPPHIALKLADFVGWLAYRVDKRHRTVAAENISHAFPLVTSAVVDELVRATYRHFARVAVEMVLLPRKFHVTSWRRYVDLYPWTPGLAAALSPRASLVVTAHFGNWELAGWMIGLTGMKTHAIARVLDNPHLERFLKRLRQGTGQTIIAKKEDFDRLTEVLGTGGKVATLADQDAGPRGLFVDFFGRPASTHKAVALMAIEFDAPLIVIGVPRVTPAANVPGGGALMYYAVVTEEVIDPRDYAGRPDAVRAITERYTAALERLIRRHPEQYFWLHRRWKTRPAVRKAKAVA